MVDFLKDNYEISYQLVLHSRYLLFQIQLKIILLTRSEFCNHTKLTKNPRFLINA